MEFAIERSSLQNGLALAQGIVERRNTIPILGNVLMETKGSSLLLSATDLEVGIRTEITCQSAKPGTITLNARKLFEIVREAEADSVALKSLEGDWVELKCGRARFKMMSLDPRTFPAMPKQGEGPPPKDTTRKPFKAELTISAEVLATLIDKTIFAVSPDETRYNLSGVYIEASPNNVVRMVATDGHRLALIEREAGKFAMEGGAILPRKGLSELRKLLDSQGDNEVQLSLESQLAWMQHGSTELS